MADEYQEVSLDCLAAGIILRFPVLTEDRLLLLGEGTRITSRIIELLRHRGICTIRMHANDATRASATGEDYAQPIGSPTEFYRKLTPNPPEQEQTKNILFRTAASRSLDEEVADLTELRRRPGPTRFPKALTPIADVATWRQAVIDRDSADVTAFDRCQKLLLDMVQRSRPDLAALEDIAFDHVRQASEDPNLAAMFARPPQDAPYPGTHAILVSRLAVALAGSLDWSLEEIMAVGIGGLCHDAGMLRISEKLYRARSRLGTLERNDLYKHPIFSLDLVTQDSDFPDYVRFITYQSHERCDGTGYPRCRPTPLIHPAARLVGLADAYVAMISARPHRKGIPPHEAILEIMRETRRGLWEPVMTKALLRVLSLYPLGSFVELSDGRLARSVQARLEDQQRPLLEVWDDPAAIAHEPGDLLDLGKQPHLSITRPMAPVQIV